MSRAPSGNIKIWSAYLSWWALWFVIQSIVISNLGYSLKISVADAAVTQLVLAISGYIINTTLRFYQPRHILRYIFTGSIALALLSAYIQLYGLQKLWAAETEYLNFADRSLMIRGAFDWLMISFITVISWLWYNLEEQKEADQRRENSDRLSKEAELASLKMQLQPHFLFNSLNSISALVTIEPERARTMIQQLSDFLRGTVKKDDKQLVTLADEIRHLQLYLDIEKIRFGHRLNTVVTADEKSTEALLPPLLLQPVVENAIKFGLYDTIGDITISIVARIENNNLVVEIKNPFDASTALPNSGTGFGLTSVNRRLYLLYTQTNLLTTQKENSIFTTLIKIPQHA